MAWIQRSYGVSNSHEKTIQAVELCLCEGIEVASNSPLPSRDGTKGVLGKYTDSENFLNEPRVPSCKNTTFMIQ
jgi:hypothetical protein